MRNMATLSSTHLKGYRTLHANAFMAFQSHWALQPLQLKNIFASKGAVKVERIWN